VTTTVNLYVTEQYFFLQLHIKDIIFLHWCNEEMLLNKLFSFIAYTCDLSCYGYSAGVSFKRKHSLMNMYGDHKMLAKKYKDISLTDLRYVVIIDLPLCI